MSLILGFYSAWTPAIAVAATFLICGAAACCVLYVAHLFHTHPQPDTCLLCRRTDGR